MSRDGWRVERVQVLLRLDGPVPLCTERWTVVAERDGVDRIPWPVRSELAGEHDVRVASGALLTGTDWSPMKRREFSLRFPRPLVAGESHEFSLEIRIPRIHPVRPLHIFRAPRHCSEIDLVVRFDVDRLPCSVGRVGSEFDGDDSGPVTVNPVGEVEMSFRNALPDRDCGIRWAPDTRSHLERRTG
ncbi:hypothetical protein [Umezawaea sp. Da 62-37]|uniref:hypothetical protein n=1 Tax=Umezawaea sp. Da 62-37 TaxID=3075927 RepID=UPI0028F703AB|nr:hypothetical protein [Umezawaea sp. Da 62-37]WNV90398.1 hypothetical protein RM788_19580 [Umezawaea sp. Da 62-37]